MDSRFLTFLGVAFLLVLSPGPTMAVVTETAVDYGRRAALWTVVGVGVANTLLALAAALGMSVLVAAHPSMLDAVTVAGALYLGYLGARSLRRALGGSGGALPGWGAGGHALGASPGRASRASSFGKGVTTNLLNPSVLLFYMSVVPQFIAREDRFLGRFALLAGSHVAMAVTWHSAYAWSLGTVSERLARPVARRVMGFVTGLVLLGFGFRLLWR